MKVKSARIRNFRCLRDVTVNFANMTAFLGSNGSGKSTILRALDTFYSGSPGITIEDFYNRDASAPIEIDLTFFDFTSEEKTMFASKIDGEEMSVMRVFEFEGGRGSGRYYGTSLQYPGFASVRSKSGMEKRTLYNQLAKEKSDYGLSSAARIDQVEPALAAWEQKNPDKCTRARDDGQFFGFTNIANGKLQKGTSFVFIPAVRDAAAEAADSRGAAVAQLMELVVRTAIERKAEVQQFRARISNEYRELMDPAKLPELGNLADEISTTLKTFYANAAVDLQWQAIDDIDAPPPNARVSLEEDNFRAPVERTGHGLQRAFILSLLQHLALASSRAVENEEEEIEEGEEEGDGSAFETDSENGSPMEMSAEESRPMLPGLILAIEEPELYQHPTKQRHFAKVLAQLAAGTLPGVARQMQIVFATHSPLFVRMDDFASVRLARRTALGDGIPRETVLQESTIEEICRALENVRSEKSGSFAAPTLLARLHIMNSEVCEGFFSNVVVLVEGPSDRAALTAAAQLDGIDFESIGVSIIPCGAANNIDRPALIFRELGIPVFIMWDSDSGEKQDQIKRNRALQRLMNLPDAEIKDAPTFVRDNGACFGKELEEMMITEIGKDVFDRILTEKKAQFDLEDRDDALKVPACMASVLAAAAAEGKRSNTLAKIVNAIKSMA